MEVSQLEWLQIHSLYCPSPSGRYHPVGSPVRVLSAELSTKRIDALMLELWISVVGEDEDTAGYRSDINDCHY